MLLWIGFACLTAAVVALLLRPLRTSAPEQDAVGAVDADLAVYRDQLRELEAERDRGLGVEGDIESARAEIARRLLKRARTAPDGSLALNEAPETSGAANARDPAAVAHSRARTIYAGLAAALPVLAVAIYVFTGSPGLPAQPYAERIAQRPNTDPATAAGIVELIERVEVRLREKPDDGKGWDAIAPVYLRIGRFADAAHAFAEANRLEGESVRRLLGFAEATMMAENGIVTEPARRAALRILELEPKRIDVGIWLALAKEQDGDLAGALAAYREILAKAPAEAPWRQAVTDRIGVVERKMAGGPAATPQAKVPESNQTPASKETAPAPSAAAPSAAPAGPPAASGAPDVAAMSPAEREAFITSMVDRLAQRLAQDGKDLDGWLRLARAYTVLGRESDARGALASARTNFASETASLAEIDKAEENLGLKSKE